MSAGRLQPRRPLYLVVILPGDPLLAGDVRRLQEAQYLAGQILFRWYRGVGRLRALPVRLLDGTAPAVMQEFHVDVRNLMSAKLELQPAGTGNLTDNGSLDVIRRRESEQLLHFFRLAEDDHPFLGLGNPDLGRRQPGVFERHALKPDLTALLARELAHCRREPAAPAVGGGAEQPLVSRR